MRSGDYIFREREDGGLEFVGDFEGLYRNDPDPWGQSMRQAGLDGYYRFSRERLAATLVDLVPQGRVLEVGAGHGHVVRFLADRLGPAVAVEGMDISEQACVRARELYPDLAFHVGDIACLSEGPGPYDAVIFNQMLWYVAENLSAALGNAVSLLPAGGCLVLVTAFLERQRFAKEIVDGFGGMLSFILSRHSHELRLIEARYDDSDRFDGYHDGLAVFRKFRS